MKLPPRKQRAAVPIILHYGHLYISLLYRNHIEPVNFQEDDEQCYPMRHGLQRSYYFGYETVSSSQRNWHRRNEPKEHASGHFELLCDSSEDFGSQSRKNPRHSANRFVLRIPRNHNLTKSA